MARMMQGAQGTLVSCKRDPNPGTGKRGQRGLLLRLSLAEMVGVPRKERLVERQRVFQGNGTEYAKADGKE